MQLALWEVGLLALVTLIGVSSLAGLIKRRQNSLIEKLREQVQQEKQRRQAAARAAKKKAKKKADKQRRVA